MAAVLVALALVGSGGLLVLVFLRDRPEEDAQLMDRQGRPIYDATPGDWR